MPARSTISSTSRAGAGTETFGLIEERLDEISRAIVGATVAAQKPHFDPEPFERIEARISALARQIEEVAEDRPTGEVIERINLLSERVDDIAARHAMPDEAIERLAHQIAVIADKIDRAPPIADASEIFSGIEQRFDVLSGLIERRQGDALEQGNMLFRELERRLDEVADRIDRRQTDAALDSTSIMGAIDARFSALAQRLETRQARRRRQLPPSAGSKPGWKTFRSGSTSRRPSLRRSTPNSCATSNRRSPACRRISPGRARRFRISRISRPGSRKSRNPSPAAAKR